jgi:hypothetical protein
VLEATLGARRASSRALDHADESTPKFRTRMAWINFVNHLHLGWATDHCSISCELSLHRIHQKRILPFRHEGHCLVRSRNRCFCVRLPDRSWHPSDPPSFVTSGDPRFYFCSDFDFCRLDTCDEPSVRYKMKHRPNQSAPADGPMTLPLYPRKFHQMTL